MCFRCQPSLYRSIFSNTGHSFSNTEVENVAFLKVHLKQVNDRPCCESDRVLKVGCIYVERVSPRAGKFIWVHPSAGLIHSNSFVRPAVHTRQIHSVTKPNIINARLPTAGWYRESSWPSLKNYSGSSWDFRGHNTHMLQNKGKTMHHECSHYTNTIKKDRDSPAYPKNVL